MRDSKVSRGERRVVLRLIRSNPEASRRHGGARARSSQVAIFWVSWAVVGYRHVQRIAVRRSYGLHVLRRMSVIKPPPMAPDGETRAEYNPSPNSQ